MFQLHCNIVKDHKTTILEESFPQRENNVSNNNEDYEMPIGNDGSYIFIVDNIENLIHG